MLTVIIAGLMLSGCMTTQEFGEGISLGAVGAGSAPLAVAGMVVEVVGNSSKKPVKGEPGFEAESQRQRKALLPMVISLDVHSKIKKEMTSEQAEAVAKEYCDKIERSVATGEPLVIKKEAFLRTMPDSLLPDQEEFRHTLERDPIQGGCRSSLNRAAQHKLRLLQKEG